MNKNEFKRHLNENKMEGLAITCSVIDEICGFNWAGIANDGISSIMDVHEGRVKPERVPNPLFISHGHEAVGNHSPKVKKYLRNRRWKKIGGGLVSLGGNFGSVVTQVNTTGIARHTRASAKTLAHIARINQISKRFKQSEYLTELCAVVMLMKKIKATTRGGQLVSDCIPMALASGLIGCGASVFGGVMAAKHKAIVAQTSVLLHWRAFQELQLCKVFGGSGPAMDIVRELFAQAIRSGEPDYGKADALIKEPAGWVAIQDKINLI
ncbi:hypothetical protein [uncultured Shewanella sp.]|uniref:hypothetical protein n=1 Tax=uncultured Shewanella sp. TaxID=173975 RepID=UPI0026135B8B|nr:hypothetical protein [uncultured Shewanella sp.]